MSNKLLIIEEDELALMIKEAVRVTLQEYFTPSPKDDIPELLTRKQAAKFLSVSLATIDNWANMGRINKHRSASGSVRFKKSELLACFEIHKPYSRDYIDVNRRA
jgi:excisionase family DNA binding protein